MPDTVLDCAPITDLARLQARFGALLDEPRAASFLGIAPRTLRRWRELGTGPAYCELRFEHRTLVRYPSVEVERFLLEKMVLPQDRRACGRLDPAA